LFPPATGVLPVAGPTTITGGSVGVGGGGAAVGAGVGFCSAVACVATPPWLCVVGGGREDVGTGVGLTACLVGSGLLGTAVG